MDYQIKRLSDLPASSDIAGLYTLGVNSSNAGVKIPLGDILGSVVPSPTPTQGGTSSFSTGGAYTRIPTQILVDTSTQGMVSLLLVNAAGSPIGTTQSFSVGTSSGGSGGDINQEVINGLMDTDSALSSRITALENAANPLTLSLTRTGSSLVEYTGNSVSVTVTRTAKRGGTTVSSVDSAYTRYTAPSGTSTDLDTTATPTQASTVTISAYGLHSFSAGATVGGMSATASTSVRLELPMYFGFTAASSAASLSIVTLAKKQLAESPKGTVTLNNPTTGYHLWLCVPSRMSISGVTSSGFEVPMSSPVTATTNLGSYKCYRSASDSGLNAGDITITIS